MNSYSRRTVLLIATSGLLAMSALAEQGVNPEQPKMLHRTTFVVKPDKAPDFQDLIRNRLVPAYEKNGHQMSTWRGSGAMGDFFRFTFVSAHDSFADFDKGPGWDKAMGEGAAATTWAPFRDCITSMEASVDRIRWDLSYRKDDAPVGMAVIVHLISAPGKEAEIEAFFKNDVIAALFTSVEYYVARREENLSTKQN